jgi:diguanylate cyclase (GGDEF)-like protein
MMTAQHHVRAPGLSISDSAPECALCGRPPVDPVTGLGDRWTWAQRAPALLAQIFQQDRSAALLVVDVDNFKQVNDRFGHSAGDMALAAIADAVCQQTRPADLVCRAGSGADEFMILMAADARIATGVAGGIRLAVDRLALDCPTHGGMTVITGLSVSCGYAVCDPAALARRDELPTLGQLALAADDALLRAKAASDAGATWPFYWGQR